MSPFEAYVDLDGVNWSTLKHLWRGSPLHYRHALEQQDADTTSRLSGRALHTLVLEGPVAFADRYAVFEGDRRGNAWKDFQAAHPGEILRAVERDAVLAQADAVLRHPEVLALLTDALTESAITWTDPDTGIACKGLVDARGLAHHADLKGTGALHLFERLAIRDGYHLQAAWYRRGERITTGRDVVPHLIAVEAKAPHDVGVFRLSDALLDHADRELTGLLRTLRACLDAERWPGRFPEVVPMELPDWMLDPDRVESDDEDQEEVP